MQPTREHDLEKYFDRAVASLLLDIHRDMVTYEITSILRRDQVGKYGSVTALELLEFLMPTDQMDNPFWLMIVKPEPFKTCLLDKQQ